MIPTLRIGSRIDTMIVLGYTANPTPTDDSEHGIVIGYEFPFYLVANVHKSTDNRVWLANVYQFHSLVSAYEVYKAEARRYESRK